MARRGALARRRSAGSRACESGRAASTCSRLPRRTSAAPPATLHVACGNSPTTCTAPTATSTIRSPTPSLFSFNSPLGACETCRGFGRVIGVDYGLVIPDEAKTLRDGAVKPWQTQSFKECQDDLRKFAQQARRSARRALARLAREHKRLGPRRRRRLGELEQVVAGQLVRRASASSSGSKPRPTRCTCACCCRAIARTRRADCDGARLKTRRVAMATRQSRATPIAVLAAAAALTRRAASKLGATRRCKRCPGSRVHDLMLLPIERTRAFFDDVQLPQPLDEATDLLLGEIRARLEISVPTSASAISRSIGSRARCRAAKSSASISRPRSALRWSTRCSCSTSRRSACIRATCGA